MALTYLITGAQGFIGRYLASAILNSRPAAQVLGVGRSEQSPGYFSHTITGPYGPMRAPLPERMQKVFEGERYRYRQVDILEPGQVIALLEEFRPHEIVHLASGLRGDAREILFRTNVEGTARLLEAAGRVESYSPSIVLGSSGGVYGQALANELPFCETAPGNPIDEYCISKLSAELLAGMLSLRFGFRLRIARIFNVIGAGQDERHVAGRIAAELLRIQEGQQRSLQLGSLSSTRDFIDVRDAASALMLLLGDSLPDGVYNIASGVETSIQQLLDAFLDASGMGVELAQGPLRVDDIPRHFADIGKIAGIGFVLNHNLADSARAVWSYYRNLWDTDRHDLAQAAIARST